MTEEDGVVVHIGAAQVEQPGEVVQRGHPVVAGAVSLQGLAQGRELVAPRGAGVRWQVLEHRRRGQARAVGPDAVQHIVGGVQAPGRCGQHGQRIGQLLRLGQAHDAAVQGQRGALQSVQAQGLQPLRVSRNGGAIELDQINAAACQLGLGLGPVAAVGEHGGALGGHQQGAGRAGEAAEVHTPLPALGQVLREVGVAAGQQHGLPALLGHVGAQGAQAGRDGRGRGRRGSVGGGSGVGGCGHGRGALRRVRRLWRFAPMLPWAASACRR